MDIREELLNGASIFRMRQAFSMCQHGSDDDNTRQASGERSSCTPSERITTRSRYRQLIWPLAEPTISKIQPKACLVAHPSRLFVLASDSSSIYGSRGDEA